MPSPFYTDKFTQAQRIDARIKHYDGVPCLCDQCTERRLPRAEGKK